MPRRFALSTLGNAEAAAADLQHREGSPTSRGVGIIDCAGEYDSERALKNHPRAAECIR